MIAEAGDVVEPIGAPRLPLLDATDDGRLESLRRMDGPRARAAAVQELEVVFLTQLVEALRRTLPDGALFPKTPGSDVYEGLFDREMATALAERDPLGMAAQLGAGAEIHAVPGDAVDVVPPVVGTVSSPFGPRRDPVSGARRMHHGVDLAVPAGTAVRAVAAGRVVASGWSGDAGRRVVLEHGGNYRTVYAHAGRTLVREGDTVVAGQVIATVGSSGRSTGPHLHFEVSQSGVALDPTRAEFTAEAMRRAAAGVGIKVAG